MNNTEIKQKIIEACPDLKDARCVYYNEDCTHCIPTIQLAHVLRVLIPGNNLTFGTLYENLGNGEKRYLVFYRSLGRFCKWNLSKDFDGQEESVKMFVGELLK